MAALCTAVPYANAFSEQCVAGQMLDNTTLT